MTGSGIRLRPLSPLDAGALVDAASDGQLWKIPFTVVPSSETVDGYIRHALEGVASGAVIPFVTQILATGRIVGSTRFWKIDRRNRSLEIGHTWLSASWQRTFVNTEAKLLMLRFAFEEMGCIRVQFTTDENNIRSRAAIMRLGAKEEGLIRNERIMPDGRRTVRYSIIDDEWPAVKDALARKIEGCK